MRNRFLLMVVALILAGSSYGDGCNPFGGAGSMWQCVSSYDIENQNECVDCIEQEVEDGQDWCFANCGDEDEDDDAPDSGVDQCLEYVEETAKFYLFECITSSFDDPVDPVDP